MKSIGITILIVLLNIFWLAYLPKGQDITPNEEGVCKYKCVDLDTVSSSDSSSNLDAFTLNVPTSGSSTVPLCPNILFPSACFKTSTMLLEYSFSARVGRGRNYKWTGFFNKASKKWETYSCDHDYGDCLDLSLGTGLYQSGTAMEQQCYTSDCFVGTTLRDVDYPLRVVTPTGGLNQTTLGLVIPEGLGPNSVSTTVPTNTPSYVRMTLDEITSPNIAFVALAMSWANSTMNLTVGQTYYFGLENGHSQVSQSGGALNNLLSDSTYKNSAIFPIAFFPNGAGALSGNLVRMHLALVTNEDFFTVDMGGDTFWSWMNDNTWWLAVLCTVLTLCCYVVCYMYIAPSTLIAIIFSALCVVLIIPTIVVGIAIIVLAVVSVDDGRMTVLLILGIILCAPCVLATCFCMLCLAFCIPILLVISLPACLVLLCCLGAVYSLFFGIYGTDDLYADIGLYISFLA